MEIIEFCEGDRKARILLADKKVLAEAMFDFYQSHGLPADVFLDELDKYLRETATVLMFPEDYHTFLTNCHKAMVDRGEDTTLLDVHLKEASDYLRISC